MTILQQSQGGVGGVGSGEDSNVPTVKQRPCEQR